MLLAWCSTSRVVFLIDVFAWEKSVLWVENELGLCLLCGQWL